MKVLIYGDSMLDVSINGRVDRISPEAPVPILLQRSQKYSIGGAANVAQCLQALGVTVTLVTCVGNDKHGTDLRKLAESHGIIFKCIPIENAQTTVKTRFWSSNQQLFRFDQEQPISIQNINPDNIVGVVDPLDFDLIAFSDYGKGFITSELISRVCQMVDGRIPLVCDPKGSDASKYQNIFSITPNFKEALVLCGLPLSSNTLDRVLLLRMLQKFRDDYHIAFPIITLAEHGIAYFLDDELFIQKTLETQLADPTGAGDTALAAFSYGLCNGYPISKAVKYACAASSFTVTHVGTGPCPLLEMESRYLQLC
tara:strand:- start:26804 stop:27739 length:936 start_codon:yes stop_codon:yes gene_type:complete